MHPPFIDVTEKNFEVSDAYLEYRSAQERAASLRTIFKADEAKRQRRLYDLLAPLCGVLEDAVHDTAQEIINAERLLTPRRRLLFRARDEQERQTRIDSLQSEGAAVVFGTNETRNGDVIQMSTIGTGSSELRINRALAMRLSLSVAEGTTNYGAHLVLSDGEELHRVTTIEPEQVSQLEERIQDVIASTTWIGGHYEVISLKHHLHARNRIADYLPLDNQADSIAWLKASREYNQSYTLALDLQQCRAATAAE